MIRDELDLDAVAYCNKAVAIAGINPKTSICDAVALATDPKASAK